LIILKVKCALVFTVRQRKKPAGCYSFVENIPATTGQLGEENVEGRWHKFGYEDIINRDKNNLDITWLKDKSLAVLDNLPDPFF
jgi:type I restriction enzyme M protein